MSTNTHLDNTRERIKRAARTLFAEKGFAAVTVDSIAAAAEANKAMLYYHFRNKEDLYLTLINEDLEEVSARIASALDRGTTASEKIHFFLAAYAEEIAKNPELFVIVFRELTGLGEKGAWSVPKHYTDAIQAIAQILQEGMSNGEFRRVDADMAAHALIGMVSMYFIQAAITKCCFPVERIISSSVDLFLKGILAPDKAGSQPHNQASGQAEKCPGSDIS
ncbi:MAG: TetR/AcrR family transcriptional regulator [Armatimonadota bacterium]